LPRLDRAVADFFVDLPFVDKASNASFKTAGNKGKSLGGTDFFCAVLLAAVENKDLKFEYLTKHACSLKIYQRGLKWRRLYSGAHMAPAILIQRQT